MKSWTKLVAALPALLTISAATCDSARLAHIAYEAQDDLVGRSEASIRSCAGEPVREQKRGHWLYLTYAVKPEDKSGPPTCVASFKLRHGIVEVLEYADHTGGIVRKRGDCGIIIEPCMLD